MGIVGGNLADIGANEQSMRTTAEMAVKSGTETGSAATALHGAIVEATGNLVKEFERIAAELKADIGRAAGQLEASDWHGQSREKAVLIKADLTTKVDNVMTTAATNLAAEQKAFCDRSDALVADIEGKFKAVMGQVETDYTALANAARVTMQRFEDADQTIQMG
jgi:hypothetical protein